MCNYTEITYVLHKYKNPIYAKKNSLYKIKANYRDYSLFNVDSLRIDESLNQKWKKLAFLPFFLPKLLLLMKKQFKNLVSFYNNVNDDKKLHL